MSMNQWEPYRGIMNLRQVADRLMQGSALAGSLLGEAQGQVMRMDVAETGDAYLVRVSLPGAKPEDIQVTVEENELRIVAEITDDGHEEARNWLVREHRYGRFQRSVSLPTRVEADRVDANYEHGVLTLRMPKAQGEQRRRIQVKTGRGADGRAEGPPGTDTMRTTARDMQGGQAAATTEDLGQGGRDATAEGDEVTAQSQESFPASDPPSWTPTTRIGDEQKTT